MVHLTACCYRVTYACQSESSLYIYLNVKEHLAQNRHSIWSLSDCNGTRTHNNLVGKQTLNHLVYLVKLLSCVVSTYLYHTVDCILLSCHVRVSEWVLTLYLPKSQQLFDRNQHDIWLLSVCDGTPTYNHLVHKRTLNHLTRLAKWIICVTSSYLYSAFHCMLLSCQYALQSESSLYFWLNVKEFLAPNRRDIWTLNDCKPTRTNNQLVRKRALNHLAKLAKWLSCIVSNYRYGAFDCMLLSCHVLFSEWILTLFLAEIQQTPFSKQTRYLKFKWLEWD